MADVSILYLELRPFQRAYEIEVIVRRPLPWLRMIRFIMIALPLLCMTRYGDTREVRSTFESSGGLMPLAPLPVLVFLIRHTPFIQVFLGLLFIISLLTFLCLAVSVGYACPLLGGFVLFLLLRMSFRVDVRRAEIE